MTQTKKISVLGLTALFLVNFAYMADFVIVPAADAIYTEFADAPMAVLNFILTGTQLMAIVGALLSPLLMRQFSKKNIIVILFGIFTIAACCGGLVANAYYMAVMRAIVGCTFGALVPVALALINEIYHDDSKKCSFLIGSFNAIMAIIGAAMSVVAGWLCAVHWNYVFYEYLAAIPILLLMIFCIPKTPPEKDQEVAVSKSDAKAKMPLDRVLAMNMALVFFGIIYIFMCYQCSMYLAETGLGDSRVSGVLSSVMTFGSMIGGFAFAVIFLKIKRITPGIMFLILGLAYVGCCFPVNVIWVGVCYFLLGFAYGTVLPYYYMYATVIVPPSKASMSLSFTSAAVGIGTFLSSYLTTFLLDTMDITERVQLCPYYAVASILAAVISIVLGVRCHKKGMDDAYFKSQQQE